MVSLWLLACGFLFVDINEAVVYGVDVIINEKITGKNCGCCIEISLKMF